VSYATTTYFGVNSFKFVNDKGAVTIGRYQLTVAIRSASTASLGRRKRQTHQSTLS
jgi:hypothetical protein